MPKTPAPALPRIRRILFPTDFSDHCYKAMPYAQLLASVDGAEIHLVHVVEEVPMVSEMGMYFQGGVFQIDVFLTAAQARLDVEKTRFEGIWKPVRLEVRVGDPATQIDNYAREEGVDMIVMSTHQPGFFERLVRGSVAEGTVRGSPCPVLIVPDGANQE